MKEIDIVRNRVDVFSRVLQEIPEVVYVGNPLLRKPTTHANIEEGIQIGEKLADILVRYRKIAGYGRGFAAPQIGISKSVFATFVDDHIQTFINPKIVATSRTVNYYRELCLSSGIFSADVARSEWIEMQWMDTEGKSQHGNFDGFLARLYQHEEGHLRGIVNIDICEHGGLEICTFDPLKEKLRTLRDS